MMSTNAMRQSDIDVQTLQKDWLTLSPHERIERALAELPREPMLTSSFGAQSIVLLKIFNDVAPKVPIWVIDTGFLFNETYRYIDEVANRLNLNLKLIRPEISAKWLEVRFGQLWRGDKADIERYNQIVKVHPLRKAIEKHNICTWFSGLRWQQSYERANRQVVEYQNGMYKVHPIIDWSDERIQSFIKQYDLPEHPLVDQGYASIGDWHSSAPIEQGKSAEQSRFGGVVRECGIHQTW